MVDIVTFIQFDFNWQTFAKLKEKNPLFKFYMVTDDNNEVGVVDITEDAESRVGEKENFLTYCTLECLSSTTTTSSPKLEEKVFTYNGSASVDEVIEHFTLAKQTFRDIGFPEESIMVGSVSSF